jgi:hypothetical protein
MGKMEETKSIARVCTPAGWYEFYTPYEADNAAYLFRSGSRTLRAWTEDGAETVINPDMAVIIEVRPYDSTRGELASENAKLRALCEKFHGYYVSGTLTPCDFCDSYDCEGTAPATCKADEYDPEGIVVEEIERSMHELGMETG